MAKTRFEIEAEIKDAQAKLAALNKEFKSLGGSAETEMKRASAATSSFGNIFKGTFAAGVAQQALGGTIGLVQSLGKAMVSGNAEMENYKAQFEVMLGGLEKANKMFGDLQAFGASTPFEFTDLASATQTLLGFGIASEEIMTDLQFLGDVAGGNAQKFQGLSLVYAQVRANGKLMGGDLLQMINQGFNPLKEISEMTGKSIGQLRDDMEKGAITADMVTAAFKRATGEGGQFDGMMEKQSKTFSGMLSTLKDTISMTLTALGGPIFEAVKSVVDGLGKLFADPKVQQALADFGKAFSSIASQLVGALLPVIQRLLPVIVSLASAVSDLLGKALKTAWPLFDAILKVVEKLAPVLVRLVQAVGRLLKAFEPLIQMLADRMVAEADRLVEVMDALLTVLETLMPVIVTLAPVIANVTSAMITLVNGPAWALVKIGEGIVGSVKWLIENAEKAASAIASIFGGGDSGATGKMTGAWTGPAIGLAGNRAIQSAGARSLMMGDKPAAPGAGGTPPPPPDPAKAKKDRDDAYKAAMADNKRSEEAGVKLLEGMGYTEKQILDVKARYSELRLDLARKFRQDEETVASAAHDWKMALMDAEQVKDKEQTEFIQKERDRREELEKRHADKLRELREKAWNLQKKDAIERAKAEVDLAKKVAEAKWKAGDDILGGLAAVAKEGSDMAKAVAIAQATMDTWRAANAAYASAAAIPGVGFVLGPVAAAAAVAAGLANVQKITSVKAMAEGGVINRPVFVAGEAGAEIVAPMAAVPQMIAESVRLALEGGPKPVGKRGARDSFGARVSIGVDAFGRGSNKAVFRKARTQA